MKDPKISAKDMNSSSVEKGSEDYCHARGSTMTVDVTLEIAAFPSLRVKAS